MIFETVRETELLPVAEKVRKQGNVLKDGIIELCRLFCASYFRGKFTSTRNVSALSIYKGAMKNSLTVVNIYIYT